MLPREVVCCGGAQCGGDAAHAVEQQLDLAAVPVRTEPMLPCQLNEWLMARSGSGTHLLLLMDAVSKQRLVDIANARHAGSDGDFRA